MIEEKLFLLFIYTFHLPTSSSSSLFSFSSSFSYPLPYRPTFFLCLTNLLLILPSTCTSRISFSFLPRHFPLQFTLPPPLSLPPLLPPVPVPFPPPPLNSPLHLLHHQALQFSRLFHKQHTQRPASPLFSLSFLFNDFLPYLLFLPSFLPSFIQFFLPSFNTPINSFFFVCIHS